jgi:Arylsulfotransferase (ASST)
VAKFSRVLVLRVDTQNKTATLVRSYQHPKKLLAPFEGNAQFLANGNVLVGWGAAPYISELDSRGRVLFDAYYGQGKPPGQDADTYRAYRFEWHGYPIEDPVVVVRKDTVYVSWNGATEVVRWQVLAGSDRKNLRPVKTVAKGGFETAIPVEEASFYAVRALDRNWDVLATSRTIKPSG